VGVFLRWGIFGIIAVAALVYAYNAIGHLADRRKASPPTAVAPPPVDADAPTPSRAREPGPAGASAQGEEIPERCRIELDVARRAVEARSIGEPLDRLLRIQEIAWEKDDPRRARLTELATRWYGASGPVDAARLHRDVVIPCIEFRR
jgi:hypothetical protein